MLVIKNLSKTFHNKSILKDINVTINRGEIAVFLGASGVGKSTLLRILNNLETFDTGTIELDGKPLDINTVTKSHTVGFVFQNFNLFEHLNVLENITLALQKTAGKTKQEAANLALTLLEQYGLKDKARTAIARLSGGQKQRVALARTLALAPKIVCLDEPSSALDPVLTAQIAQIIKKLAADGYMVLIATHDTGLLEQLPCTIYFMEHGSIVEIANSTDLKNNPARYQALSAFISGK